MAWVYPCLIRQLTNHAQTLYQHEHGASGEISTSNAIMKQGVTRKSDILLRTIDKHTPRSMARSLQKCKLMGTKTNHIIRGQEFAYR